MGISPGKLEPGDGKAAMVASCASAFSKILHRRILRCGAVTFALLGLAALSTTDARAQEERPQITPGERKAPRKKTPDPRAFGVLRLAANNKATFVPIAILVSGKFWDATAYKADPIPMALESGTVYEAERAGNSLGLFTVSSALHSTSSKAQNPWIGTGVWRPAGSEPAEKTLKAEAAPLGIDTTDQPPRLTRDPNAVKSAPPAGSAPASGSGQGSAKTPPPPADPDGPPRLSKPASPPADSTAPSGSPSSTSAPSTSAPSTSAPSSGAPPASAPDSSKGAATKSDEKANIPASDSGAGQGYRPVLRRGKPAESFADEEVPGYSKPGSKPATGADAAKLPAPATDKDDVQLIPAISDAAGPVPRSFKFEWLKGEEGDRSKQMMALAKDQIRAYVAARAKAKITAIPASKAAPAKRTAKPVEPILENVKMVAYDLWNSNQAVIIFSAEAHMPPPAAGSPHSEVDSEMQYSVMVIAYPDIYNNLHKLYSGITDKFHLDVTPRLDLIDAVDADGDNRGELLFRETTDQGTGWVLYRANADKLWKIFDSLRPE